MKKRDRKASLFFPILKHIIAYLQNHVSISKHTIVTLQNLVSNLKQPVDTLASVFQN